jgi:YD repeat-containing protein
LYQFNSSWYLSEVESPGAEEKLVFDYHTLSGPYTAPVNIHLNEYRVKSGDQFDSEHCGSPQVSLVTQTPSQMQIYDRRLLKSIRLESPEGGVREELSFAIQSTGEDYPNFKLTDITLKKRWQETPLKTVSRTTLGYDNSTGRLTLKSVLEEGIDPNGQALAKPPYSLTYNGGQLPDIGSGNIDHWGYNNACGNSLIPAALDCNSGQDIVGQGGANRESNEDAMKEGTLTGITYPTGGRTQWEWEANRVHGRPCVGASPVVGGLRVKTITDYTGGAQIAQRRTYRYVTTGAGGPEISSGMLFSEPVYYMSTSYHNEPPPGVSYDDPPPPWSEEYTCYSIYVYPTSLGVLGAVQGSHVGYSRVEEIIGTVQDNIGKNVYYYHTEPISEATQFTTHANGDLIKKEGYDKDGVLVRKEELLYSYQSEETANSATAVNLKAESWQAQSSETLLCQTSENPLQFEWRVVGGQYSPSCLASKRFKSKYKRKAFFFKQIWKYVSEKTATDYFYENGAQSTVVKRLSYVYGDQTVNLPTAQFFTNSDGVEHRLETRYHKWVYIKGIPEEITYKVGGAVVGGQLLTFQAGKPLNFYEKLKGGGTLLRGQISAYSAGGSPEDFTWMAFPTGDFYWENGLMTRRQKLDWQWSWAYNERRLLTGTTDIDGQQLSFGYDALDRLQTSSARQGNIVSTYTYEYGTPNRITQTTTYTDAPTQTVVQTFDGLGRPTNMRHNNVLKKEWIYDAYGRLEKETYLPGNLMTYIYDDSPLNRVIQVIYPDNSETETRYGAQDNYYKTTVLDEKENETQTFTDLLGRTHKIIDAHGGQTLYTYDASGNLERVDPPIGLPYEYRYDIRNRMISKDVPGAETQYLRYYDQTDLLKFAVDGNRNRLDYAYDAYGREQEVRLATGVNINPDQEQFGSPGDLIRDNTYGEALGGIHVGKLTQSRAKMLDGTANFVANTYAYDPFGRMTGQLDNYTLGGVNFSDSWLFSFNHADWQTAIARKHNRGAQALDVVATMAHDNFGREIMYIFGSVPGDAMAVTRAFNDRDELIQKQYGSLGSGSYLEKTVFRYTPRGWIEEMNPVVARKDDWTYCSRPTQPPAPNGVHEEAQISLDELLDRIAAGEQVSVNDLGPCENGECYERLYTWEVSYDLWRSANNAITQIRAAGQTLNLAQLQLRNSRQPATARRPERLADGQRVCLCRYRL